MRIGFATRLRWTVATLAFIWIASALPALAICCTCSPAGNVTNKTCLTSQIATSCAGLPSQSNNTNLSGYTCTDLDTTACQPAASSGGTCTQGPTDATSFSGSAAPPPVQVIVPTLNVPIPGLTFANQLPIVSAAGQRQAYQIPFLGQYIAAVDRYLLAISVIAASVMVVYGGFKYILGSTASSVSSGKETIRDALIGLVLVFSAYTILNVFNPATVQPASLTVPIVEPSIYTVSDASYQTLQQQAVSEGYKPDPAIAAAVKSASGGTQPSGTRMFPNNPFDSRTTLPADQINNILQTIATANNIDVCVLKAITATESGGRENAIGFDSDANYVNIQARLDFLRSGKKYSGATFDPPPLPGSCTTATCQPILNMSGVASIRNDDALTTVPPDYGLDWRFSHGFGVGQVTIFPAGGKAPSCKGPQGDLGVPISGTCFTVPILMTWEGQLDAMAKLIKGKAGQTSDPCKIFQGYSGAVNDTDCSGPLLSKKMAAYSSCKGTS